MYIRPYAGKYRVEVNKSGRSASWLAPSKAEAVRWGQEKEAEFEALRGGSGATFGAAVKHYLATVSTRKKHGAVAWESRRFAAMAEFFGMATSMVEITRRRVTQWRDHRLKTVKGSTVDREANLLRNLFLVARTEWEWIRHNPFEGVRMPNDADPR